MAIDGQDARNGARMQGYLRRSLGIRRNVRFGGTNQLELGLVVKVHHKDYATNQSQSYAEYDVLVLSTLSIISNVPVLGFKLNEQSGDEFTLKAATNIPQLGDPTTVENNIVESDGDLVLFSCINGYAPIIMGTMNHLKSGTDTAPWHGAAADGERRAWHHKGTSVILNEDSTVEINLPDDKDLTISIDGSQLFRVHNNGGTKTVELGAGTEKVVLGETFRTWFNGTVSPHTHQAGLYVAPVGGGAVTGTSGASVASLDMDASNLSDVTKTE